MLMVHGHVIISSREFDFPYAPVLETYALGSFNGHWSPTTHLDLHNIISNSYLITHLHFNDLGIDRGWRMASGGAWVDLGLYRSSLRRDTWKLMLYVSGIFMLESDMSPAKPPRKRTIPWFSSCKVVPTEPQVAAELLTYRIPAPASEAKVGEFDLRIVLTSTIPSINTGNSDSISYAGYVYSLGARDGTVVDLRLHRWPELSPVLRRDRNKKVDLSPWSGALTRVVESGAMVESYA